jgi:catechol 2,3-dioxygenase-like lactoylglutathione lyase family enzyme
MVAHSRTHSDGSSKSQPARLGLTLLDPHVDRGVGLANAVSIATVCSVPVDHVKLPVRDLEASRMFYEAALAPFGYRLVYDGETSLGFGVGDGGNEDEPFAVERREAQGMPSHIAFTAASIEQVDAFHTAALSAGGEQNGAPGERPYGGYYYAAFVLDPDGHNIEAVYHGER